MRRPWQRTSSQLNDAPSVAPWREPRSRPLLALLPPLIAVLIELVFRDLVGPHVWFPFYPAIFITSWIGDRRFGLITTALTTVMAWWLFVEPAMSIGGKPPHEFLAAVMFFITGVLFTMFHDRLRKTNDRLRRIAEERRVFEALVENSSDFIGIARADGKPVYLNPSGRRMVGLAMDHPIEETTLEDFYFPDQRDYASKVILAKTMEQGQWQGETTFRNWRTGASIPVSDTHFMIRDRQTGRLLGMGTVTRDISDIKRAQEATEAANRSLHKTNEEVTRLYEKLKELDEIKTRFFANISHELRTPLALILGPIEKYLSVPAKLGPDLRRDLEVVDRNARTVLKNIDDLLDVARLEAGRLKAEYRDADAADLVRFVSEHFSLLAKEKEIALSIDAPATLSVQVDTGKLQRILINLLSNAFKFTPNGGRIRMSLRAAGGRFIVEVGDSGPGIPESKRAEVFERFHQLEAEPTRRFAGTGLGLSIVRDFAALLGGTVTIGDAPEGGALFVVDLPSTAPPGTVVQPRIGPADAPAPEASPLSTGVPEVRPVRPSDDTPPETDRDALVLVVEDNHEMSQLVTRSLIADGYRVATAFDGREGYEKAVELNPDLVLTDIMMPEVSGDEMVRLLRQRVELLSTPIVILTAKADDEFRVRLLRSGADDYLEKPFSVEELRARVRNLVIRKRAEDHINRLRQQVEDVSQASKSVSEAVADLPESSVRAVLEMIAVNARNLTAADFAAVGIGDDPSRPFDTWVFAGLSAEEAEKIGPPPRPVGLLGLVSKQNRAVRLRDLRSHPEYLGFPANHPLMTSFIGVPIRFRGRAVGNLYVANKRGSTEFDRHDQRLVQMLADGVGVAIETARLYSAEGTERAWLEAVVDQMPEGIVLMDAEGRVTLENRVMRALASEPRGLDRFGNTVTVDLRRPSGEPLAADEFPIVRALIHEETIHGQELVAWRPDGRSVPLLVSAAPIRESGGQLAGATMILQDASTLKALEQLREEWASIIAHDLQQPINAVVLRADLLVRTGLTDQQLEGVRQIRTAAMGLSRMVNDLTDASQIDTHQLRVNFERVDVGNLVRDIVERMPDARARTKVQTPGRSLFIRGDAQRLEQVITNLLSNALKYGMPDTGIRVDVRPCDDHAEVSVANRGAGIPAEELPVLFERYARSRAARRSRTRGLGLGLYIAKGLVEAHGGRIWAESTPGQTTTFHFTVPLDLGPPSATGATPTEEGVAHGDLTGARA